MAKKKVAPETKVVCPACGAEFAIPEQESLVVGVVIGKDSNLGTIYPATVAQSAPDTTPAQMKAEAKIEALRKAGINVDNIFSMKGVTGTEDIARMDKGQFTIIPDDDPIFAAIIKKGTVPNPRLFRRWVMSQVFHMLTYCGSYRNEGVVAALNAKGYKYQWKMVVEEIRVQAKLAVDDVENFRLRNRWFNNQSVYEMAVDYIEQLNQHIKKLKVRHCKGVPYVRLGSRDIFVSDIEAKIIRPLKNLSIYIASAKNPAALYAAVLKFFKFIKDTHLRNDMNLAMSFKNAYKGAGAYFTMKNLILFHGAVFKNGCVKISQQKSLAMLENKANEYATEGWRLFGLMKKLINDNNIDIERKMAEWRK